MLDTKQAQGYFFLNISFKHMCFSNCPVNTYMAIISHIAGYYHQYRSQHYSLRILLSINSIIVEVSALFNENNSELQLLTRRGARIFVEFNVYSWDSRNGTEVYYYKHRQQCECQQSGHCPLDYETFKHSPCYLPGHSETYILHLRHSEQLFFPERRVKNSSFNKTGRVNR